MTDTLTPEQLRASHLSPSDLPRPQDQHGVEDTCSQNSDTQKGILQPEKSAVPDWPVYVVLSNGCVYGCDVIVSATGVVPNTGWLMEVVKDDKKLRLAEDGGIVVDSVMRSSVEGVYAAGDVCTAEWEGQSKTWFQVSNSCSVFEGESTPLPVEMFKY